MDKKETIEINSSETRTFFGPRILLCDPRPFSRCSLFRSSEDPSLKKDAKSEDRAKDTLNEMYAKKIKYECLTRTDMEKLESHSVKKINALCAESGIKSFFRRIESFVKKRSDRVDTYRSTRNLHEVIDYIRECGVAHRGIFRIPGSPPVCKDIIRQLKSGRYVDCSAYSLDNLASALKAYIREELDGIIPDVVCASLVRICREGDQQLVAQAKLHFPFVFSGNRRELLLRMIELFRSLEQNVSANCMPISNLVCVMPCVFFPERYCVDYKTAMVMSSMLNEFLRLDYELLPASLYMEFKSLSPNL